MATRRTTNTYEEARKLRLEENKKRFEVITILLHYWTFFFSQFFYDILHFVSSIRMFVQK